MPIPRQSVVTAFAKFLGVSGLIPLATASSYAISCSGSTAMSAVSIPCKTKVAEIATVRSGVGGSVGGCL